MMCTNVKMKKDIDWRTKQVEKRVAIKRGKQDTPIQNFSEAKLSSFLNRCILLPLFIMPPLFYFRLNHCPRILSQ